MKLTLKQYYFSKLQNLLGVNQFSTNVLFLFQDPLPSLILRLVVISPILVFQGAITQYHRLGDLKNRRLFLAVVETGKSKVKVPVQ